jgi:hypothetical protein
LKIGLKMAKNLLKPPGFSLQNFKNSLKIAKKKPLKTTSWFFFAKLKNGLKLAKIL